MHYFCAQFCCAAATQIARARLVHDMQPVQLIEELNARLGELLAASPAQDVERNVKALVASALERLELATREELDVQTKVLVRTREKLAALESRVAELEERLRSSG